MQRGDKKVFLCNIRVQISHLLHAWFTSVVLTLSGCLISALSLRKMVNVIITILEPQYIADSSLPPLSLLENMKFIQED